MKAISSATLLWYPVVTISAPKAKKVRTCRIELTFSLKTTKSSAIARSAMPSEMPQTKAAISPLPKVTSASP